MTPRPTIYMRLVSSPDSWNKGSVQGEFRNRSMAQILKGLWERVQGKWHLKIICSHVFNQYAGNKPLMALDKLHVATLRVFDSLNKNLLGPHKQPPSASAIADKEKEYRKTKTEINENEFYETILEWTSKDLRIYMANKIILACLASPALTIVTKNAGKRVPRIGHVVEKIPAPVLFSAYSALIVFHPDIRVE